MRGSGLKLFLFPGIIASVMKKENGKALEYFQKAIECGFKNLSHIRKDKDLDFIRNEKEFREMTGKLSSD